MRKELFQNIEIPEEVNVDLEGSTLVIKGSEGENKRKFILGKLKLEKKDNQIIIGSKNSTKKEKKMMNTIATHIKNMIKGVQEKFEYKLKICFSHFPINVDLKDNGAIIKNFLGEKIPRKVKLPKDIEIKNDGGIITINSSNKELAGQAAANFETATRIRNKDRRVFQDGIFIINKAGRDI